MRKGKHVVQVVAAAALPFHHHVHPSPCTAVTWRVLHSPHSWLRSWLVTDLYPLALPYPPQGYTALILAGFCVFFFAASTLALARIKWQNR